MILVIDNRDSFVWNLVEYISMFDRVRVVSNSVTLSEVRQIDPDGIVISPGPGHPENRRDVGNCPEIVVETKVPLLGVCLGHQLIAHAFGGRVERVQPVHGKASPVEHDGKGVFRGLSNPLVAGRYHSLAITEVPKGFRVTARADGVVMGVRSRDGMIEGVQFHPESVLTPRNDGIRMIRNFVERCRK